MRRRTSNPVLTRAGRLLALLSALATGPVYAQEEPSTNDDSTEEDQDPLAPYRAPFEVLAERAIGTSSKPVEFNWRRTRVHVAALGDHPFELNNFNSMRAGALVRFPSGGLLYEVSANYVWVWDSPSSELLALTPYRQPGRPWRVELEATAALPLAEGVVTTFPRWFPAAQMVFNVYAGARYELYPTSFKGMKVRDVGAALFSPTLGEDELANLEDLRLDAMQVDPARYAIIAGVGNDIYFRQGLFFSPRLMLAVPILAPVTETDMLFQADLCLAIGIAL